MRPDDLLGDVTDLLVVGASEWLSERAAAGESERSLTTARAERRARLARLGSQLERLHEIDARIDLVETAADVPHREDLVAKLRALRERVERSARRR